MYVILFKLSTVLLFAKILYWIKKAIIFDIKGVVTKTSKLFLGLQVKNIL